MSDKNPKWPPFSLTIAKIEHNLIDFCYINMILFCPFLCICRPVHDVVGHLPSTVSFRESQCSPTDPPVPVTSSTSVASWNTGQSPGGATGRCSYQLHVQSGQRWKLTLLDFTTVSPKKTATKPNLANEISTPRDVPTCLKYARVQVDILNIKLVRICFKEFDRCFVNKTN